MVPTAISGSSKGTRTIRTDGRGGHGDRGILAEARPLTGGISIRFQPLGDVLQYDVEVVDYAYRMNAKRFTLSAERVPHGISPFMLDLDTREGWYDAGIRIRGYEGFEVRYAGRVETGAPGITDPFMGGLV
jgi:phospholipase C